MGLQISRCLGILLLTGCMLTLQARGVKSSEVTLEQKLIDTMKKRDSAIRTIALSTEGPLDPRGREKMKAIVGDAFDYHELSRRSLKKHWPKRTPAERKEFADLYRRLIEKSYADPKLYRKVEKIVYDGADVVNSLARVKTTVHYKGETSAMVYALHRVGEKWLIIDMVIDDVSVVRNNRQNFYREIAKSSYGKLVEKIKNKLSEEPSDSDKASAKTF